MTFRKNYIWQPEDEEMGMKILRKGDNKCKGPEVEFCWFVSRTGSLIRLSGED